MIDLFVSEETLKAAAISIKDWITINPAWAGSIVFLLSMSESLAVIGLFIPGLLVMGLIGGLVYLDILDLIPTLTYAVLGAIAGDGISYYLGYAFKDHLPNYWPFRKYPQWLQRGKTFFIDHGSKSIVIGRFVGPVRPFIPVVAGMMHMSPGVFLFANILSALLWAPIYMVPGFVIAEIWFLD
ncbi:MAG TPA: DedA family protein [Gammaproteobacteria bacterium]|nr:DedA family protein [Gammaproteobacteria bacterium]